MASRFATHEHHEFLEAAHEALGSPNLQLALSRLGETLAAGNRTAFERLPTNLTKDPHVMAQFARGYLRQKFAEADVGITGGNFLVAETGTVVIVSNEGNARLTTSIPRIMVSIVGIEKLIPRLSDLPI